MHKRRWQWLGLSMLILILDQYSKVVAWHRLVVPGVTIHYLPELNFSLAFNRGAAFSFLSDASGWQNIFFIGLTSVFLIWLVRWLLRATTAGESIALALIIGGAMGNGLDRCHYGFVVDFIDVHLGVYHWPTFNVADSAICIGVGLLMLTNKGWRARKDSNLRPPGS